MNYLALEEVRSAPAVGDDMALVESARRGHEFAFREIMRRYNQRLFRVARAVVRDDAEAEDIVQESYVRAFTHLETFRGEAQLSTWLIRIALNEALGRKRRRRPTVELDGMPAEAGDILLGEAHTDAPPSPESELGRNEARRLLESAIDLLPESFRTVFVMRDVEGLTTDEVAGQLHINEATVKTRLFRARRLLRETLSNELQSAFEGLFPFDGARCVNMADRVIARLKSQI